MINREDMLELTRRMTPSRTSFSRIAGCYVDADGEFDGSFNTNFLKLPPQEKKKNLEIAKTIPFSGTNMELRKYRFADGASQKDGIWRLLTAMKDCGLKNDALMDTFYDVVMEELGAGQPYAVFVFYGCYDIPAKASDKERLWESEEVFEHLICAVCPLVGEYEPGLPTCGFLFPAFTDRSAEPEAIAVYQSEAAGKRGDGLKKILNLKEEKSSCKK